MSSEHDYIAEREAIVATARRMVTGGLTEHTSGNVSCRLPVDATTGENMPRYAITPHGLDYFEMETQHIVLLDATGETVDTSAGNDGQARMASAEKAVHLAVYQARPDVQAVMHAHPTHVQMLAVAGVALPSIIDEAWVELGAEVRVAEYAISGTDELATNVVKALGDDRACLMASHGMLAAGRDLGHALEIAEMIEHLSEVYVGAQSLGGARLLPEAAENLYGGVYAYKRQQENAEAEGEHE